LSISPESTPSGRADIPSIKLFVFAVITGLAAIFLEEYTPYIFILVPLIWPAFISSANGVRSLASYGLGTGTSSIGYWGTAVGATIVYAGIMLEAHPVVEIAAALTGGAITGICAQKIIKMRIPVMIRESAILAAATAIIIRFLIGLFPLQVSLLFPLMYIAVTLAVLHPYNGSMGAGENQKRTLWLSAVEAAMTTALFGLILLLMASWWTGAGIIVISSIGFIVCVRGWYRHVKQDVYKISWTGFPEAEH
jgi:tetrahydromethanopterin S-methyltransferase subunit C